MKSREAKKLLGGYAAGNLTEEERRQLFEAALEDQELFESLAAEEPLRDLLSDPATRARLVRELEPEQRVPWFRRPLVWSRLRCVSRVAGNRGRHIPATRNAGAKAGTGCPG